MKDLLQRSWWMLALQGLFALLFGVLALLWPSVTLLWLVIMFSAYAMLSGIVAVIAGIGNRKSDSRWWLVLLMGVVSIAVAIIAILNPALTAIALVLLMGANALVTGVIQLAIAIRLRKQIEREWVLVLAGVVSIIFGALVLIFPGAGALALVWLISFYAMLSGVLLLMLAFRAKGWGRTGRTETEHLHPAH
jgi:uncharacterized membrane protein HdeD (DUF308 family)